MYPEKGAQNYLTVIRGKIIIGIEDDGTIIGINESKIDGMFKSLSQSIYKAVTPVIFPKVYTKRIDDKIVLIIEIAEGMSKPYYRASQGMENGTYIRMGKSTVKATAEIIQELQWRGKGVSWDETPVYGAARSDLDDDKMLAFLKGRKNGFKSDLTESYYLLSRSK